MFGHLQQLILWKCTRSGGVGDGTTDPTQVSVAICELHAEREAHEISRMQGVETVGWVIELLMHFVACCYFRSDPRRRFRSARLYLAVD